MNEQRTCKYCGKTLTRRLDQNKREALRDFKRRQFCDKICSGKHSREGALAKKAEQEPTLIEQAISDTESGEEQKFKTGVEILREIANDPTLDKLTRLNAAAKLAPYETRKASESKKGLKGERADAAKKAASGRFSAGAPPVTMARVK